MSDFQIECVPYGSMQPRKEYDIDRILFDLDSQVDSLSSQADKFDYLVSIGSGLLCASLDILWVGDFSLERGRAIADEKVNAFVTKAAKMLGFEGEDLESAVRFLEGKFPIPSDGNTPTFGGGLQHHLQDFAHHPTIVGLVFSLLTQFTHKAYGTDVNGVFRIADVPDKSLTVIGKDVPAKILFGTVYWFFHLVSDMAGSSGSIGKGSGGTGIPGPILSLAKGFSALPFFRNVNVGDNTLSVFLSKLFNGTFLAQHDEAGNIIKDTALRFDLRGELGAAIELARQAIPIVANECIVRGFFFIRHLAAEIKANNLQSFDDLSQVDWGNVWPANNPTIARMLTISTGVFSTVDIGEAIVTQKYWVSINYVGVGRFAVAVGEDVTWILKARTVKAKAIKQIYEDMAHNSFRNMDNNLYKRMGEGMNYDKLGLTVEQTEILYNLEYYKTLNDIHIAKTPFGTESIKALKHNWLNEWKDYITNAFPSFLQIENAQLHWYTEQEFISKVEQNGPERTWFRLVLLEAMLFEPYYPLSLEEDKKGNEVPSKKYRELQNPVNGYSKGAGDNYLNNLFTGNYYTKGYIARLRKCYGKVLAELNEVLKGVIKTLVVTAVATVAVVVTAGVFAGPIAVALVGSNFAGLSGAALTSACLAYLGGGAVAAGGLGILGGTATIVGGGALLGLGVGASVGGAVGAAGVLGKQNTILQSAKLLVALREIFLNDGHDVAYSNSIYEKYVQNIMAIEKGLVELRLQADVSDGKKKKELVMEIKRAEESAEAMKIAMKSMKRFLSAFEEGLALM